jgi:hypothetical protein
MTDIAGLEATFGSLTRLLELSTDAFDAKSDGVTRVTKFIQRNVDIVNAKPTDENGKAQQRLRQCLLLKLNAPWLDADDVRQMHESLKIDPKTIRAFFKNQRTRYITAMQVSLKADVDTLFQQMDELDRFIDAYFEDIERQPLEPQSSPSLGARGS